MDCRPDAVARLRGADRTAGLILGRQQLAELAHVLDRDADRQLEGLARAGIDDPDLARLPRPAGPDAAEESRDRLDRPLRGRKPNPLGRLRSQLLQPLQAEGEVGAPLRSGKSVDLVHDDVLYAAQDFGRLAGEDQVERLRRRDQDVRRIANEMTPLVRRSVAGPDSDFDVQHRLAKALGRESDSCQRRPQVSLDVVDKRFERRDV